MQRKSTVMSLKPARRSTIAALALAAAATSLSLPSLASADTFTWSNNPPGDASWDVGQTNANYLQYWNMWSNWTPATGNIGTDVLPNAPGVTAKFNSTRAATPTLLLPLGQDITVGALSMLETTNTSFYIGTTTAGATPELPATTLVFDSGVDGTAATWVRNKAGAAALRMAVYCNLRLDSDLNTTWKIARATQINSTINGAGKLSFNETFDTAAANYIVTFGPANGATPSTYSGGTSISSTNLGFFVADKNKAFGSGDISVSGLAVLQLNHRSSTADDMIDDSASLSLASTTAKLALANSVSESISDLYIDGVLQAAGTYTSTNFGTHYSGTGTGAIVSNPYTEVLTSNGAASNWSDAATWTRDTNAIRSANTTPTANGKVLVQNGNAVTVDANSYARRIEISGAGSKLAVGSGKSLDLLNLTWGGGVAGVSGGGMVSSLGSTLELQQNATVQARFLALSGSTTMATGSSLTATEALTVGNLAMNGATINANGAVFIVNPRSTVTVDSGSSLYADSVTLGAGANFSYNNDWVINAVNGAGNLNMNGKALTLGGGAASGENQGAISGVGTTLTKTGSGVITLRGPSTFTGAVNVQGGTLAFGSVADLGIASALGAPANAADGTINVADGALLKYVGTDPAGHSTNRTVAFGYAGMFDASGAGVLRVTGNITGTNLVKSGTGTLWVDCTAGYLGSTEITGGALRAADGTGLPAASLLTLNGGVLESSGTFARTLGTDVTWNSGGFAAQGAPLAVTFGGSPTEPLVWGSTFGFITGNMIMGSTSADNEVNLTQAIDLNGVSRTIQVNDNPASTGDVARIGGTVSGAAGIIKTGLGELKLTGVNTYTGKTVVQDGTLTFDSIGNVGAATGSALGQPADAATGQIDIGINASTNVPTLKYVGPAASTDRVINLSGANSLVTLDASGTGPITFTSPLTAIGGKRVLTLAGTNTGDNTLAGAIPAGGTTNLVKKGTGTWMLNATNAYTGSTTISGGTLKLGPSGVINASSGITINGTTAAFMTDSATAVTKAITFTRGTLGGTGDIGVAVTVNANKIISPGSPVGTQTYTNALTFGTGGTYKWEIKDATGLEGVAYDVLKPTGAFSVTATTAAPFTIGITGLAADNTVGAVSSFSNGSNYQWKIIDAAATVSTFDATVFALDTTNFATANPLGAGVFSIARGDDAAITGGDDSQVWLRFIASTGPLTLKWDGADGDWDMSKQNWKLDPGATPAIYSNNQNVIFDDTTATAVTNINVTADVQPASVLVDNTTKNYTIGGTGKLTGAMSLTKQGSGTLTLNGPADYTGGTTVNAGTLKVGTALNSALEIKGGAFAEANADLSVNAPVKVNADATLTLNASQHTRAPQFDPAAKVVLNASDVQLNIQDSAAIGAISPATLTSVWSLVRSGYNGPTGAWTGTGITTTAVTNSSLNGLGLVLSGDPTLEAQTLTVREMILGDVNGDNKVTIGDVMVALNSANYQQDGTWLNGDVNYDGKVTIGDVMLMLNSTRYQQDYNPANAPAQIAALEAAGLGSLASAAVPEPATLGLLAVGAMGFLARRRRA